MAKLLDIFFLPSYSQEDIIALDCRVTWTDPFKTGINYPATSCYNKVLFTSSFKNYWMFDEAVNFYVLPEFNRLHLAMAKNHSGYTVMICGKTIDEIGRIKILICL